MRKYELPLAVAAALVAGLGALALSRLSLRWGAAIIAAMLLAAVLFLVPLAQRALLFMLGSIVAFHIGTGLPPILSDPGHIGLSQELAVQAVDILVLALVMHRLARWATQRVEIQFFPSITVPALVWLAVSALSALNAVAPNDSIIQISQLAELMLMYLVVANSIEGETDANWLVQGMLFGVFFEGLLGTYEWFRGHTAGLAFLGEPNALYYGRPVGTIGHPNGFSLYLAAIMPTGVALLFLRRGRLFKLWLGFALAAASFGLLFSLSRGGWLAFAVGFIAVLVFANRRKRQDLRIAFAGAMLMLLIFSALIYTQRDLIAGAAHRPQAQVSAASRITMAQGAISLIRDYPLMGIGLNNYVLWMPRYDSVDFVRQGVVLIHNIYLLVAAETGLLGLAAFLWFLLTLIFHALRLIGRAQTEMVWLGGAGAFAAVAALAVHGTADYDVLANATVFRLLWIFAALLAAMESCARRQRVTPDKSLLIADTVETG